MVPVYFRGHSQRDYMDLVVLYLGKNKQKRDRQKEGAGSSASGSPRDVSGNARS